MILRASDFKDKSFFTGLAEDAQRLGIIPKGSLSSDEGDSVIDIDELEIEVRPIKSNTQKSVKSEGILSKSTLTHNAYIDNILTEKNTKPSDESTQDEEPNNEDCFITDKPRGGYEVSCGGKYIDNFTEFDDGMAAIRKWRKQHKYWPNIWLISDHGNSLLIDEKGNEIKQ